jgi:diguanylate cyclase (GGDEF)-like protein
LEEDINTELHVLESHLDGMLGRIQHNSQTLKRFQDFEKRLLDLNSLAEMIEHLLEDAKTFFDLDVISLCLIDEKAEIAGFLHDDDYDYQKNDALVLLDDNELLKSTFGISTAPFLGAYKQSNCAGFFPKLDRKPVSVAIIPLKRRGKYLGSLNFGSYTPNRFINDMATDFIEHMVSVVSICLENNLNFEMMSRTSLIDTLTGVNNRRFLEQRIGEEVDRSRRNGEPLSCLFLDIDHFKKVNDTYGHQAGDYVLSSVASLIKDELRSNDVLARYGGEEFVALLSNIPEMMVADIAERIRRSIESLPLIYSDKSIKVTISIGSSTFYPSKASSKNTAADISTKLIHSADSALYVAKEDGRNRVASGELVQDIADNSRLAS